MDEIPHSRPWLTDDDRIAVKEALDSGFVAQGARVAELEGAVAQAAGARESVAAGSGTAALTLALRGLELPPGAEVVVPTYVCVNVLQAVVAAAARPVLCDVGEEWTMTAEEVRPALGPDVAAIVAVHTMGVPCDVAGLRGLGLPIVEDAAQAWVSSADGGAAGTVGDIRVVSTHATKCFTTGEGGFALISDASIGRRLREIRDGDAGERPRLPAPMSDLQAALGLSQLARYDMFLTRRRQLADRYFDALADLDVGLPEAVRDRSMFFRFPVRAAGEFAATQERFAAAGIQVRKGVDTLLHRLLNLDAERFPVAERLYSETVSLPLYPALDDEAADRVIATSRAVWSRRPS